jgi:hypothetical protein
MQLCEDECYNRYHHDSKWIILGVWFAWKASLRLHMGVNALFQCL